MIFLLGNEKITEFLIDKGSVVNYKNSKGQCALHHAVINGNEKVVNILIKNGADVNAKDDNENTPLHLAVEYGV